MRRLWTLLPLLLACAADAAEPEPSAVAAALSSLAPARQPSGLLLGLRDGQSYRTLYLVHGNGRITLVADLPFILSPQQDGFWRFGSATSWPQGCVQQACDPDQGDCAEDICRVSVTQIWQSPRLSGPVTMPSVATRDETLRDIEDSDAADAGFYIRDERIEFVARGALCRSVSGHGYVGGAHDFFEQDTHCFAVGGDLRWGEPLVYPAKAAAAEPRFGAVLETLEAAAREGHFEEVEGAEADHEVLGSIRKALGTGEVQFRLDRVHGQTQLVLTAESSTSFVASPTYTLTVAAPLGPAPAMLVAHNPGPDAYNALRKIAPEVVDVFVAPSRAVAYALSGQALTAIDPASGATLWSSPVRHDRVVMVEWATGADIERWAQAAATAKAP